MQQSPSDERSCRPPPSQTLPGQDPKTTKTNHLFSQPEISPIIPCEVKESLIHTTYFSVLLVSFRNRKCPNMVCPHRSLRRSPQQKHCHEIYKRNYLIQSIRGRTHVVNRTPPDGVAHLLPHQQTTPARCRPLVAKMWRCNGALLILYAPSESQNSNSQTYIYYIKYLCCENTTSLLSAE